MMRHRDTQRLIAARLQKIQMIMVALALFLSTQVKSHENAKDEVVPFHEPQYSSCFDCVTSANTHLFWCPYDQKCYYSTADIRGTASILGRDCSRPEDYDKLIQWSIPKSHQWQRDLFTACLTVYAEYPLTNVTSQVVTNCSLSYNSQTGVKETDQPARIIIDDQHLKKNMPEPALKYYSIQPGEMCQIMLANTLSNDYRHFFNWFDQTFAYWSVAKYAPERLDNLQILWDQTTEIREDEWDQVYKNNTSFSYTRDYDKIPVNSTLGLTEFDIKELNQVQLLWPREMIYLYVINKGQTPQEFHISYSAAQPNIMLSSSVATSLAALVFLTVALV